MSDRTILNGWIQDWVHAGRLFRKQPGFVLAIALTLALGLGVNATVLGMMDALLLRPYQFPDYQRIVVLWSSSKGTSDRQSVAPADYLDWRRLTSAVEHLVAWEGWNATMTGRDAPAPQRVMAYRVSPGFFEVLGVPPAVGRSLAPEEEQPGKDRTAVIGDGLWKQRLGGDPRIIGKQILIDGEPYTVVGIAPPGFDFPVGAQLWAPLALTPARAANRTDRHLTVMGKLRPDATVVDAQAELATIARRLEEQYPDTNRDRAVLVRPLSTAFREDTSGAFVGVLQAGAGLVLLIACANLAGLLLARANDRRREVAMRTALGAGRGRIVRQLMTEMVLLALASSMLALLLARAGLDLLRSSIPADIAQHIEGWNNVRLDVRLVLAIPALAVGLGLLLGLIPAFASTRSDLTSVLKEGERGATGGKGRQRIRQALVVSEIAFALALLVGAGLTLRAGTRMVNQSGGFDAGHLLRFDIPLPESKYADPGARRALADALIDRIDAVPGIESIALTNVLPASGWSPSVAFAAEHETDLDRSRQRQAGFRVVSSTYFATLKIPIVSGRAFSDFDREGSQQVAIVSASLADRLWGSRDPIGRRLRLDRPSSAWLTVVGVVGDVSMYNWWDGLDLTAIYVPLRQAPAAGSIAAVLRTAGEPTASAGAVRAAVASVDPLIAIDGVRTMDRAIVDSTFGLNFLASLMGICGGLALVLSFVGIFSMMAYAISQRTHEFGVRMALGATSHDVLRMAVRQAAILTASGVAIGLGVAVVLGRLMSSAIAGVISLDVETFLAVSVLLAVVSLTAAYLPARRSLRLDAAAILRGQ